MAEEHLRERGVAEPDWNMRRFRFSENLSEGMWASVITEVERRGERWVVTRLDRNPEPLDETGFHPL